MALRERMVHGVVVDADGTPITNAKIKFKPTQPLGYTTTHIIVDKEFEAITDNVTGEFSKTLWADEDSLVPIDYNVYFPVANGGEAQSDHAAYFSLEYGDGSTIELPSLLLLSMPAPSPGEGLYDFIVDIVDTLASLEIGSPVDFSTSKSVLFIDETGELAQAPGKFEYDHVKKTLKLVDSNYIPFAGSLNADVQFSVGSNDNIQNNLGIIETSNHWVTAAHDVKVLASGVGKWYIGTLTNLRVTGTTYSGSGQMIGHMVQVNNRTNLIATPYVYGVDATINLEGHAVESVGGRFASYRGSAVNCDKFVGIRATAQNGYTNALELTGVEGLARTGSAGATVTMARPIWAHLITNSGHTFQYVYGVHIGGWLSSGVSERIYGLYIDNTIDVGSILTRAIKSESTSLSEFAGQIQVPSSPLNDTWVTSNNVATQKDVVAGFYERSASHTHFSMYDFNDVPVGLTINGWLVNQSQSQMWGLVPLTDMSGIEGFGVTSINLRTGAANNMTVTYGRETTTSNENRSTRLGIGVVEPTFRFSIITPSDVTNTYTIRCGLMNIFNGVPSNGCFFRYTHSVNGGKWEAVCRDTGTETAVDTGFAVSGSVSMHKFKVSVNAAGTSVDFFIDGSLVATVTANIPNGSTKLIGTVWQLVRSAGTAETQVGWMDYVTHSQTFTTPR